MLASPSRRIYGTTDADLAEAAILGGKPRHARLGAAGQGRLLGLRDRFWPANAAWEPPVWLDKWETDAAYERQTRFLLEHYRTLRPAFATHNVRSIAHALAVADELGVPQRAIEFQALYGMADPIKDVLVRMGQRVRVYTPYGQLLPGMAYLVRRLLENTSNESFLRASFSEKCP